MEELKITKTGIPFLDSLLGGGFLGSVVIISQQSGVKFWELVHRILYNNYDDKFYLILVTFHLSLKEYKDRVKYAINNPESLKEIMKILSTGHLSVIDCFNISNDEEGSKEDNVHYVSNPFNIDNLLSVMANVRDNVPRGKRVYWYFPDITNMSIGVPDDDLVKFCRRAFRYHKQHEDLSIYILNEGVHTGTFFGKLFQLSDVYIKLIAKETSWGIENSIQVLKNPFQIQTKKAFYDVNENMETQFRNNELENKPQILPINSLSKNRALESGYDKEYSKIIRTGIPTLDSLLGGGILSNSIIVSTYQPGATFAELLMYIMFIVQNQLGEKNHIILINYTLPAQQVLTYLKILGQRLGLPSDYLSLSHNLTIIDCLNLPEAKTDTQRNNIYPVSNPFDVEKLLSVMTNVRNSIPEDKRVFWAFYSLTEMSIGVPENELVKFCRRAFRYHKWCGDLAFYLLNEKAHTEIFRAKMYPLSDVLIKFIAEDTRDGLDTFIQVLKSPLNYNPIKVKFLLNEKGQMLFI
nr:hypothetical protein [Candidatus Freyarchaeota archaeon]